MLGNMGYWVLIGLTFTLLGISAYYESGWFN